jgi:hypothetical protein
MDPTESNSLLSQMSQKLDQVFSDPEMKDASLKVARAVIEALDLPDVDADAVKEVAITALGGAIEQAEEAVTSAEERLRGGRQHGR